MFGFDSIYRREYVQLTPKTTLVVNEAMQREMERLHRQGRRKRLLVLGLLLLGASIGLALIILCLKLG